MAKLFYRFRNTKRIFEDEELEKQEIYFASTEKLNDPMEGFKNLVFKGDKIVWRNLFKHYLLCLEYMYQTYLICGEIHIKYNADLIPIFRTIDDIETPLYKELFNKIYFDVFEIYGELVDKIATRTTYISKDELIRYLYPFNLVALEVIQKHYELNGLIPKRYNVTEIQKFSIDNIMKSIDAIEDMIKEHGNEKMDRFLNFSVLFYKELDFIQNLNFKETPNKLFLLNFTQNYLKAIEKLTYPKNYIACFTGEEAVHNSSVWGHYGDSHKGVCLIFEADESQAISFTNAKVGYHLKGVMLGKINLSFEEITYDKAYLEIDFFRSLGRLPIPKLNSMWYIDGKKNISDIHKEVFDDEDEWRKGYWDKYSNNNLIKTKDWEYEDEYRLLLNAGMDGEIDETYRKLKYDFQNLKGLIFGINTPMNEKVKIFEIIKNKCIEYQRNNFEFYEAYYCNFNKNIQFKKIDINFVKTEKNTEMGNLI
ncbi:MAG: DUF2971 domain-containing protein [Campylobacterales bacterium]|nr:DUF2971 domain-containing protein [Campylobacterales bacterium]